MTLKRTTLATRLHLGWAALLLAPALLGARGCDVAVVGSECGGLNGAKCGANQFCDFAIGEFCGAADATGACRTIPEICTQQFDPVCGCDDQTYSNACVANAAGVSVASKGECPTAGQACSGLQGLQCASGEFCDFAPDAACGAADQAGVCTVLPEACIGLSIYRPVCGCDDKTYGSGCEANAAGVSVASEGECASPGNACGGLLGLQCSDGEFCDFAPDAFCGAADQTGTCTARPEDCAGVFAPVCGCDDQTYSNACAAHSAGVAVASEGGCGAGGGNSCGGLLGGACADGEFCNFAIGDFCGAADATGTCELRPEICTLQFDPVCGCDDQTYSNACAAHSAGVSVASEGECASAGGSACGGLLGLDCNAGEFCDFASGDFCGAADATGTCEVRPEICTLQFDPVCGCDDQTYSNACAAHSAGVAVASDGECANAGSACGGLLGLDCNAGEFCDFAIGDFCGAADATGTCRTIPEICTLESNPVCGCDGMTYGNACAANSAGVSVASTGECP